MSLYEITTYRNNVLTYRDRVHRNQSDASKEIYRLIRKHFSQGLITSKPMLNYVLRFEPGPHVLTAVAQSKPDENGHTITYRYQMEEVLSNDDIE